LNNLLYKKQKIAEDPQTIIQNQKNQNE